ncbi:MAG: efflux RND transporter periplasmic adaptor subunit [Phycisphaerales bacterium]|nr:efflux RND transporter periplasmic adaptor subunit [Phycisphaerales bacterium]
MKSVITWLVVLCLLAGGGYWAWHAWGGKAAVTSTFMTAPVQQGDLAATVSATGTLEPREVVDVGSQVSGTIIAFGKDAGANDVDYDSPVNQGTVLARIDPALFQAAVEQATANVAQTKSNVLVAQARLQQYRAALADAAADWQRAQKLGVGSGALSATQYDLYKSTFDQAQANVGVGDASLAAAKTAVQAAMAALDTAKINLGYCTITSPVKGVVIDRRVNIGQTVASSFSTPSLFLIAENLNRIQVWASVNEADIGRIKKGDSVTFTVDAFPHETFKGVVSQIRLNATMVQNVVTYTVVVDTDNPKGKLLPYLTAQMDFLVANRKNVMYVPNAALRWVPRQTQIAATAPANQAVSGGGVLGHGVVWVETGNNQVRSINVGTGLANDYNTQIVSTEIEPGMKVVVGERQAGSSSAQGAVNPFIPQPFKKKK